MKRLFYIMIACMVMTACEIQPSNNGDLDGYWQLTDVDTLSTGGTADMRENRVFWGVQKGLVETWEIGKKAVIFRFIYDESSLTLFDPYKDDRDAADIKVTDVSELYSMGINNLKEHFDVTALNGGSMTLTSSTLRLRFRKY